MEGDKRPNQNNKNDGAHHPDKRKQQPSNPLERFWVEKNKPRDPQSFNNPEPPHNPDLDLSLRLGSIHHHENTTLARSSSLVGVMTSTKDSYSLKRSCSLPTDAEQLQRRTILRDLHTMPRKADANKCLVEGKGKDKSPVPPKVAAWPPASSSRTRPTSSSTNFQVKEKQVSQTVTGTGLEGSATANIMVMPERHSNEKLLKPVKTETGNPFKWPRISHGNFEDNGMEIMRQMPSVSTTGDGPNGRKVEGFLYRYMKGHVSIMCVCHGSFLSPAEFVKHAGGRDVPNPMKHISVYSTLSV